MQDVAAAKRLWSAQERSVLDEFAAEVRNTFKERVQRIILHGSRARGDADEDSDYDVVVLFEPSYESDQKELSKLDFEVSYKYDVLLIARAIPFSNFREDTYFYFYENVCNEGIDL